MQTVTLEFETDALSALGIIPPRFFERYEEVELLETLRLESGWRLQLLRLRSRGTLRLEREARAGIPACSLSACSRCLLPL